MSDERVDPGKLEALIRAGEVDTVLTVFPDGLGRLMGKRVVGRYFLDAANTATYPGHDVVNLRLGWSPREDLRTSLRVDNLFDTAYADRADYAFGNYRYFPGRGRALFLSVDFASH